MKRAKAFSPDKCLLPRLCDYRCVMPVLDTFVLGPPYHTEGAAMTFCLNSCHVGSDVWSSPLETFYFLVALKLFS